MKILIAGNGIFGRIAADTLRRDGHFVTVVDSGRPEFPSGTRASGFLMKPSWFAKLMKPAETQAAFDLLTELYGDRHQAVDAGVYALTAKVWKTDGVHVLDLPRRTADLTADVVGYEDGQLHVREQPLPTRPVPHQPTILMADRVLLALGVGLTKLNTPLQLEHKFGGSLLVPADARHPLTAPAVRIVPFAPYRQAILRQLPGGDLWVGDGTAVSEDTWQKNRDMYRDRLLTRAETLLGLPWAQLNKAQFIEGARPILPGDTGGYCGPVSPGAPRTWVATGGGKLGTLLAARFALKLRREWA